MGIPTSRKVCPKCESTEVQRMRRSLWMRPLPKSYYYHCSYCKHRFISFRSDLMFLTGAFLFAKGEIFTVMIVLIVTAAGTELCKTPKFILSRRIIHRRLVILQLSIEIVATSLAGILAWNGFIVGAILTSDALKTPALLR